MKKLLGLWFPPLRYWYYTFDIVGWWFPQFRHMVGRLNEKEKPND